LTSLEGFSKKIIIIDLYRYVARAELVRDTGAGGERARWVGGATRESQLRTNHGHKPAYGQPMSCDGPERMRTKANQIRCQIAETEPAIQHHLPGYQNQRQISTLKHTENFGTQNQITETEPVIRVRDQEPKTIQNQIRIR
jgi:hypothetical protein